MGQQKSGNVRQKADPAENKTETESFQEGDIVALTPTALRLGNLSMMSPRLLYQIGWPNQFVVLHTFEDEENGPCVSLYPCCMVLVDRRSGNYRCTGHPAQYFEKIDVLRQPQKGDRSVSISLPLIKEIVGADYEEDEQSPRLTVRVLGQKGVITGPWAKLIKNLAEANNWI
jgi:hypothetical protein